MLNSVINVDLHIHSVASKYKEAPGLVDASNMENIDILLDALKKYEISLFSITDHNRFDSELYKALAQAIVDRDYEITLLPGIEFDVRFEEEKNACHVIAIFKANLAETSQIKAALEEEGLLASKEDSYSLEKFGDILSHIQLPTILIAQQHAGFDAPPRKRDLGKTGLVHYRFGYIDALEYSNWKTQAVLRNELLDFELPQNLFMGSDCHDWSCYPKHDCNSPEPEAYCASIRALPTFQGLLMALTSPDTRIGVSNIPSHPQYLDAIELCGKTVPISPGINAIIGENGIGKSSVLNKLVTGGKCQKWEDETTDRLGLKVERPVPLELAAIVRQGELQENSKQEIFDASFFNDIDHTPFETGVRAFTDAFKKCLQKQIEAAKCRNKAEEAVFVVNERLEGSTYYIDVQNVDDLTQTENPYEEALQGLSLVYSKLQEEIDRDNIYEEEERANLLSASELVTEVKKAIEKRSAETDAVITAKNLVLPKIKDYKKEIKARSNDIERVQQEYRDSRIEFIECVINLAKSVAKKPAFPSEIKVPADVGTSKKLDKGFSFIQTASYMGQTNLTQEFIACFNTKYRDYGVLCKLRTADDISDAIPGCTTTNWEPEWDNFVQKFIDEQEKTEKTILEVGTQVGVGSTLGERALAYYKYQSGNLEKRTVFLIDQPEDNISNQRIYDELRIYLNDLRDRCQVIMITHNPLLVVNQDVDNIIIIDEDENGPCVYSGCLECDEDEKPILSMVAELMDGGKEAIRRRLRVYDA